MAELDTEQAVKTLGKLVQTLVSGLLAGLGSVTVLIVGIVTGLFILLFLMKDWQQVATVDVACGAMAATGTASIVWLPRPRG